jgi:hypothetical protein
MDDRGTTMFHAKNWCNDRKNHVSFGFGVSNLNSSVHANELHYIVYCTCLLSDFLLSYTCLWSLNWHSVHVGHDEEVKQSIHRRAHQLHEFSKRRQGYMERKRKWFLCHSPWKCILLAIWRWWPAKQLYQTWMHMGFQTSMHTEIVPIYYWNHTYCSMVQTEKIHC